ncbi:MAG: aminotransferase class I/II-fold pyridoxal phosphate-dependent enzyme [Xanthomonadaceae bacterium]|nr:aminotransferase class I/II-fold pyridoxal phosphate-dependent enzyme [Xanthomonadaceae bacterium]
MQNPTPEYLLDLSQRAVLLSNRDHLLNKHCAELKTDHTDVFAKARVYSETINELRSHGMMQYGIPIESRPGPTVKMEFFGEKRELIMFASNDYLNLSTDPRIHEAVEKTLKEYGIGAGSSRVGTGYSYMHKALEEKIAHSFGKEAAIVLPTGYDAIASPIITLCTAKDRVIIDASSHACIVDGAYSSGATVRFFAHNDVERLNETLEKAKGRMDGGGMLVAVEGAYSMDGDIAKLPEIVKVCRAHGARLIIDEAHSIGVHGKKGHGVAEYFGLSKEVDLIGGTFSKSLGATGGFIAADKDVITYMNYLSRKIIFSAAFPPILATAVSKAMDIMESDSELRERLWNNIKYLAKGMKQIGANVLGTETASVPILIGNDSIMFSFTQDLIRNGIFTFPAVYPTVPKNKSTFRLALQSKHQKKDLDHTIEVFDKLLRKYNVQKINHS